MKRALVVGGLLTLLPTMCTARPPPGQEIDPALHGWFEKQHSISGSLCCSVADGHVLADSEWRIVGEHYEVRIDDRWIEVLPGQLRDLKGGDNPTGHAVVWYLSGDWGVRIYCFSTGTLY